MDHGCKTMKSPKVFQQSWFFDMLMISNEWPLCYHVPLLPFYVHINWNSENKILIIITVYIIINFVTVLVYLLPYNKLVFIFFYIRA